MPTSLLLLLASSLLPVATLAKPSGLFSDPSILIPESPAAQKLTLHQHPAPNVLHSPGRTAYLKHKESYQNQQAGKPGNKFNKKKGPAPKPHKPVKGTGKGQGKTTVNTIFSGVYPTVNLTWIGQGGQKQDFVSFVDTGSADTFVVGSNFSCVDIATKAPRPQSACAFGKLYNDDGAFTPNGETFSISYFPENEQLQGKFGTHPLSLAGITVPDQQVAIVDYAAWAGDGISSGLVGFAFPAVTSASAANGSSVEYNPLFTTMVAEKRVKENVFTIAIDRVPRGTPVSTDAGQLALGGLVDSKYYQPPFTSVPIEITKGTGSQLTFYSTTHQFIYGNSSTKANQPPKNVKTLTFQSIIDSGTAPNFIPTSAANELNSLFVPAAIYNSTLGYWIVDCNATAPYAAYKIGGHVFPMDKRDMIVRSLNGLPGYEDVCFSAFADGGADGPSASFLIGSVWLRSVVLAHDIGRKMLHIASRRPY